MISNQVKKYPMRINDRLNNRKPKRECLDSVTESAELRVPTGSQQMQVHGSCDDDDILVNSQEFER